MRLLALSREAVQCGLSVGTSLADARTVVPGLDVHDHDPLADAEWLDRIADGCMRFSPLVAAEPPDGVVFEIAGSAHLFGGERELAGAVQGWLAGIPVTARLAGGHSAQAARALARYHGGPLAEGDEDAAIRDLPVAALELDPESDLGLRRAGFETVGEVMDRPRQVIAARFGSASVYRLERLVGTGAKPIEARAAKVEDVYRRRFAEPIASKDYAIGVLAELLDEANAALAERERGGRAFEARFCRVDGQVRRIGVETGLPTRDSAAIARLFDERLDTLTDPLDPGFGFDEVQLRIPRTDPLAPVQDDLGSKPGSDNPLARTLDMLAVRLGRNRLLRFRPHDTHMPEDGQVAVPATRAPDPFAWPRPRAADPPMRPLQLFDPPHRIAVIAQIPDGPPRRFRWRRKLRDIVRYEGPERIAPEWWTSDEDPLGHDGLTRDYYRVEDTAGRRYWVFRHGLYGRETVDPAWYLHGLFA